MEQQHKLNVSRNKTIGIILTYGGYYLFFQQCIIFLTLLFQPDAKYVNQVLAIGVELIIVLLMLFFCHVRIQEHLRAFRFHWKRNVLWMLGGVVGLYATNLLLSPILTLFTEQVDSVNQTSIISSISITPYYMFFSTVIAAPILEEALFRIAIFGRLRMRHSFLFSACISSSLFGLGHVMNSILSGNMQDIPFVILYFSIGFVFAYVYERSQNVVVNYTVHMLNNLISVLFIMM